MFGTNTFKRPYLKWPVESFGRRKGGQRPQRKKKKIYTTQRETRKAVEMAKAAKDILYRKRCSRFWNDLSASKIKDTLSLAILKIEHI